MTETTVDPVPAPAQLPEPAQQVASLAAEAEQLLEAATRNDLAQSIRDERGRRAAGPATVVVVGETNRGKSALVNALLGRPGLSPVDSDVATNCYVEFKHAPEPYAYVQLASAAEPLTIAIEEIADWATVTGNPGNQKGVRSVEVGLPAELLDGLRLIDTPGVGGLETAHGALTLEVLREADALLFVIDTDGPLSAPELRFLELAAERIDTVIIALTKIDVERRYEELRDEDAELLRRHAPRFAGAPIVPVSSLRLEQSLKLDPERAAKRRASSGIDALLQLIAERVVRRAAVLHLANTTHVCSGALSVLADGLRERIAAVDQDPAFETQMVDKERKLAELEDELVDWQDRLSTQLDLMQMRQTAELRNATRELQHEYLARAQKIKVADQGTLISQLESELSALARRLAHEAADALASTLKEMLGISGDEQTLAGTVGKLEEEIGGFGSISAPPNVTGRAAEDSLEAVNGFMIGSKVPSLAHMVLPSIAIPGAGIAAIAGVAWMVLTHHAGAQSAGRAELRGWIRDQLEETTSSLESDFGARMILVRQEVKRINRHQVAERRRELAAAQQEFREAAAASAGQREGRRRELTEQAARIEQLLSTAERLHGELAVVGAAAGADAGASAAAGAGPPGRL